MGLSRTLRSMHSLCGTLPAAATLHFATALGLVIVHNTISIAFLPSLPILRLASLLPQALDAVSHRQRAAAQPAALQPHRLVEVPLVGDASPDAPPLGLAKVPPCLVTNLHMLLAHVAVAQQTHPLVVTMNGNMPLLKGRPKHLLWNTRFGPELVLLPQLLLVVVGPTP
jgi:hypothetical protein